MCSMIKVFGVTEDCKLTGYEKETATSNLRVIAHSTVHKFPIYKMDWDSGQRSNRLVVCKTAANLIKGC